MSNNNNDLHLWLENKEKEWEKRCGRCGHCCGASDDPCADLEFDAQGRAACRVYGQRFEREHRTVSGKIFRCLPIRSRLGGTWPGDEKCIDRRVV